MKSLGEKILRFLPGYGIVFTGSMVVTLIFHAANGISEIPLATILAMLVVSFVIHLFQQILLSDFHRYVLSESVRTVLHILVVVGSLVGVGIWLGWVVTWKEVLIYMLINLIVYGIMYLIFYLKYKDEAKKINAQLTVYKERMRQVE